MKYKELMTNLFSETITNWIKTHDENKDIRKVYSVSDLQYNSELDQSSSSVVSKCQYEKMKRRLPSLSNLTLNNTNHKTNTMLKSTLGKLLVRKLVNRSTTDITKSSIELNRPYEYENSSIMNKITILKENVQLLEEISDGKFSIVSKGIYQTKQNQLINVALKKFYQNLNYADLSNELCLIENIKHSNIIEFYGIITHVDHSIMFVLEYANFKSLYDCLTTNNSKCEYSVQILLEYLKQITSAMNYLEKRSITHQNLCCQHFFLIDQSLIKISIANFNSCRWSLSNKDKFEQSIPWLSPEVIQYQNYTSASDVYSFGISMWECYTYGQRPWEGMTNDQIINSIDVPNHQRLPRPPYATAELYDIMLNCWKHEPSERPTFQQLEKLLEQIEFRQVQWKTNSNQTREFPDNFLPFETCKLGPLTIVDRCLDISISSSSSSINNIIQCVSVNGQIGFVYNDYVEPIYVISISKQNIITSTTSSAMSSIFHRKAVIKKNSTKTKCKQISKSMISSPQLDLVHAFHIGPTDNVLNDTKTDQIDSNSKNVEQTSSFLDEVMQAFTDIYSENELVSLLDENVRLQTASSQSELINSQSNLTDIRQCSTDENSDSNNPSPIHSYISTNLTTKQPNFECHDFLTKNDKIPSNLVRNRYKTNFSCSSSTHDENSSSISSSNPEKSDCQSLSTDNDDNNSISSYNSRLLNINKCDQHPLTGQPLPPPPDLSSLGSKLTIATNKHSFQMPPSLTLNKYQMKKRSNLFS